MYKKDFEFLFYYPLSVLESYLMELKSLSVSRLYFDIETYNPKSPFFAGKVITIAYKDTGAETHILKEWDYDEKSILKDFFQHLKKQQKS